MFEESPARRADISSTKIRSRSIPIPLVLILSRKEEKRKIPTNPNVLTRGVISIFIERQEKGRRRKIRHTRHFRIWQLDLVVIGYKGGGGERGGSSYLVDQEGIVVF